MNLIKSRSHSPVRISIDARGNSPGSYVWMVRFQQPALMRKSGSTPHVTKSRGTHFRGQVYPRGRIPVVVADRGSMV